MTHALYPVWKWIHVTQTEPELARKTSRLSSQLEYVYQTLTGDRSVSLVHSFRHRADEYQLPWTGMMKS